MTLQHLTLTLDGITAGDYMTWVRDPEPHALGRSLCSIELGGDPLGDTVEAWLTWAGVPPDVRAAAASAGLALTPEVAAVEIRPNDRSGRRRRSQRRAIVGRRKRRGGCGCAQACTGYTSRTA